MENKSIINYLDNVAFHPREDISTTLDKAVVKKSVEMSCPTTYTFQNFYSKRAKKKGYTYDTFTEELLDLVKKYDNIKLLDRYYFSSEVLKRHELYFSDHTSLKLEIDNTKSDSLRVFIQCRSIIDNLVTSLVEFLDSFKDKEDPDIFVITEAYGDLQFRAIGKPALTLIEENYNPKVVEGYKYVMNELNKDEPFGRLVLMHGDPGTGKTHLVRSFLSKLNVDDIMVVFLQPEFLTSFKISSLMNLFLNVNEEKILLIIEDGDNLLVPRAGQDTSTISKLLNIADGIVGNLLNLRLLITTNADNLDIDPAIKRPGRLCSSIHVDNLEPEQAKKSFKKLTGMDMEFDEPIALANVYEKARDILQKPEKFEPELPGNKQKLGFSLT